MIEVWADDARAPVLVVAGSGRAPGTALELIGPRARTRAHIDVAVRSWRARIPLTASRWAGPELPLPAGRYRLSAVSDADDPAPGGGALDIGRLERTVLAGLSVAADADGVTVGAPLDPLHASVEGQAALERRYASRPAGALENAVFFESFYGRSTGDNPGAIDRALAERAPGVTRYWSVEDLSSPIPPGAVAVVIGSPQWWRARGRARLFVVNDWLRHRFSRRRGQHVLQTWHGTPLKKLALHRPGFAPRRALATARESQRWDILLAQNPFSARTLRSAYAYHRKPVWVEGYPRNDVLRHGDPERIRAALGVERDRRILLYAPTWRDDREGLVDDLDTRRLAQQTGSLVLVRGHSRTLSQGADASAPGVIDVTTYPDVTDLMLVADALITDYSSVMFDFAVTGKPMYFFVPDLDHYRSVVRGLAFDLVANAPGPVVSTQEELTRALLCSDEDQSAIEAAYTRWQARFTAREDGHASRRVVARILDQRLVDR